MPRALAHRSGFPTARPGRLSRMSNLPAPLAWWWHGWLATAPALARNGVR